MITCVVIADTQTWIIIIVGVILVNKELTTSVVPIYTDDNNKSYGDLLIVHNVCCILYFDSELRFRREPSISESSDLHGYVITTSINCRDRWFWTANDIIYWNEIPPLENSWVSAWTLVLQYLLFVSPPRYSQSCFQKKTGVGIAYEYLLIIGQDHFYLDYTLCLSSVRVLFTLCHGHGLWIWITWKVLQSSWEMYVDNCRLPVYDSPESIYQYIVDGNIVTHGDCSRFPNAIESGIPMSRSLCALWTRLVEVSRPLGV